MATATANNEQHGAADMPIGADSSELVHSLLRLWQVAQYRRKTILRAVCASAIIGAAYFVFAPRYYDSTAKLWIVHRNQDQVASVGDEPVLDNTMANQREIVVSPVVVQQAIEYLLPEHRLDFQDSPPSEWARILAEGLSARTARKTNIIEIRYRSRSPEAASAVASAVIQSYLQFVDRTHKGSANEVIAELSRDRDKVTQLLAAKQAELLAALQRVGHLPVQSEDGITDPTIQAALQLYNGLLETKRRRLKLQGLVISIEEAIKNGEDLHQYLVGMEEIVGRQMLISALGISPQDMMLINTQQQKASRCPDGAAENGAVLRAPLIQRSSNCKNAFARLKTIWPPTARTQASDWPPLEAPTLDRCCKRCSSNRSLRACKRNSSCRPPTAKPVTSPSSKVPRLCSCKTSSATSTVTKNNKTY